MARRENKDRRHVALAKKIAVGVGSVQPRLTFLSESQKASEHAGRASRLSLFLNLRDQHPEGRFDDTTSLPKEAVDASSCYPHEVYTHFR